MRFFGFLWRAQSRQISHKAMTYDSVFPAARPPRFPTLSLFSLTPALTFGFLSYPLFLSSIPEETLDGKEAVFGVFAAIIMATYAAAIGAVIGATLVVVAHLRHEPVVFLRALSLAGNLLVIGYAIWEWSRLATG